MTTSDTHRAIDAVWRIESARLIAGLTRMVRDVGLAEELAQDAFLIALERWPASGVPDNPGAWLMATAKRRAIDLLRRKALVERKHEQFGHEIESQQDTMEIQASRARVRINPVGEPVLLLDQDRTRWDYVLIRRGFAALQRVEQLGSAFGPYALQAAIAACHARARTAQETDWERIAALYDALVQRVPSPVIELNRAVALSMAVGPAVGLELVDALVSEPSLKAYHLLPSVRGDLLAKLGRFDEARAEFARAASLTHNARERVLLRERAAICARSRP